MAIMIKPKIITRYVLTEYFPPLILGIIIFTFVLLLDKIFDLIDLFLNRGVHILIILKLLMHILPSIVTLTIPMGFLLGSLLAFGRLSEDGEITAFRSSGQHLGRLFWPPLVASLLASISLIHFNSEIAPESQNAFRSLYREVLKQNPLVQLEERTFLEIENIRLYVESIDRESGTMKGVHIYRLEDNKPPTRIHADRGTAETLNQGIEFRLQNGTIQQLDAEDPSRTSITSFKRYHILLPFERGNAQSRKNIRSMKTSEIIHEIATYKAQDLPVNLLTTEFHLRIAVAWA
ncbi:MAG: LptF/LptG family permease, partial [Elusimicrobia bacterium]|nr:LptF/LptG family permease [Elusimicrobiota bacterium]MBD3411569.1 LptF/LptG family permease [Elusimicrobiota bacterium]